MIITTLYIFKVRRGGRRCGAETRSVVAPCAAAACAAAPILCCCCCCCCTSAAATAAPTPLRTKQSPLPVHATVRPCFFLKSLVDRVIHILILYEYVFQYFPTLYFACVLVVVKTIYHKKQLSSQPHSHIQEPPADRAASRWGRRRKRWRWRWRSPSGEVARDATEAGGRI